ncbi:membrane dipeptidase [Pedobacter yulinensis]|uniref:Membrane dipeptidase n=1 Tax=Pedobacter yulinensis TaxID=2126353 RepID=A0A2T3HJK3_9SPHI|nr:dipeptidase [Pedobacter yulinensis]PST82635.1 membrane dipeptidase [Pedobacter yulinensis]
MRVTSFIVCFFLSTWAASAQTAERLHRRAIVADTHGDILFNQIEWGVDLGQRQQRGYFDLQRAREGGLDVQIFSVWCDEKGGFALANRQIDSLYSLIDRYPKQIALVRNAVELRAAVAANKLAALIGVEGGHMIENRLDYIDSLAMRGMRYLTLTWNNSTDWSSSAADESRNRIKKPGLNDFGRQVIARLNKLGVMVDLSHVGERTFYDAIAASSKPVIASHSSVYALNPVPRNLKDEQIRAVARTGGVVFINFYSGFIDSTYSKRQDAFFKRHDTELKELTAQLRSRSNAIDELLARHGTEADAIRPSLSVLIDHIDHVVQLVGSDHVGLGADFDGAESYPRGMNSVADYPKVTAALIKRGYKTADIEKILGGNLLRVLRANTGK